MKNEKIHPVNFLIGNRFPFLEKERTKACVDMRLDDDAAVRELFRARAEKTVVKRGHRTRVLFRIDQNGLLTIYQAFGSCIFDAGIRMWMGALQ